MKAHPIGGPHQRVFPRRRFRRAGGVEAAPHPDLLPIRPQRAAAPQAQRRRRRRPPQSRPPSTGMPAGFHSAHAASHKQPFGADPERHSRPCPAPERPPLPGQPHRRHVRRQHEQIRGRRNHRRGEIENQEETQQPGGPQAFPPRPQIAREARSRSSSTAGRRGRPPAAGASPRAPPAAAIKRGAAAAYRTRCRGTAPCRASIWPAAASG